MASRVTIDEQLHDTNGGGTRRDPALSRQFTVACPLGTCVTFKSTMYSLTNRYLYFLVNLW